MSLQSALELALETIKFPKDHVLYPFGDWRLRLHGPWRFSTGVKWQAIAEPYNAHMRDDPLDDEIEGIGDTPEEALLALVTKIHKIPRSKVPKMCGCGHPFHIGLICGYPIGLTPHAVNCECEG